MSEPIVTTKWLEDHLQAPDVVIIHAILAFEKTLEELHEEYRQARIPGAILFDIDQVADSNNPLPHMLPSGAKFSSMMRKMGIGDGQRIVVYDSSGNFSASRVWWMFRTFGVDDVVVLDGGLPKWIGEGRPVTDGPPRIRQERHFTSRFRAMNVKDLDDVAGALKSNLTQVVDARSAARFSGAEKEARKELASGHMPGSINVYYKDMMNEDATMKSPQELRKIFTDAGVDLKKPTITTCGSGVTAAILTLGLELAGHTDSAVYDGSWTEWAADTANPVEQG